RDDELTSKRGLESAQGGFGVGDVLEDLEAGDEVIRAAGKVLARRVKDLCVEPGGAGARDRLGGQVDAARDNPRSNGLEVFKEISAAAADVEQRPGFREPRRRQHPPP